MTGKVSMILRMQQFITTNRSKQKFKYHIESVTFLATAEIETDCVCTSRDFLCVSILCSICPEVQPAQFTLTLVETLPRQRW